MCEKERVRVIVGCSQAMTVMFFNWEVHVWVCFIGPPLGPYGLP